MPVVGWVHPFTRERMEFGAEDRDKKLVARFPGSRVSSAGTAALPVWIVSYMQKVRDEDLRHTGFALSTTGCYGCPRAAAIKAACGYYVDPGKAWARLRGTAMHSVMAAALNPSEWITEANDRLACEVKGRLFKTLVERGDLVADGSLVTGEGVKLSGLVDAIRRDYSEIVDAKFPNDYSAKFRSATGHAKLEHALQANINRLLLAQDAKAVAAGYDPDTVRLTVWDHAAMGDQHPAVLTAPYMTEDEILASYVATKGDAGKEEPIDGALTVADNIVLWVVTAQNLALAQTDTEREAVAAATPCTASLKYKGAGCTKYCDVNVESEALKRKYGETVR